MSSSSTSTLPAPVQVGVRAAEIHGRVTTHPLYGRLRTSSQRYAECWATFTGYPTISMWDLERDAAPLFDDALRVLCLKAAVYELSGGNEQAAELHVPACVDEMVHAILAQHNVLTELQMRLGVLFPHMTDREEFAYDRGGYTDHCWAAAGFAEQNTRYWFGREEMGRRLDFLNERYGHAGLGRDGRRHTIDFEAMAGAAA